METEIIVKYAKKYKTTRSEAKVLAIRMNPDLYKAIKIFCAKKDLKLIDYMIAVFANDLEKRKEIN